MKYLFLILMLIASVAKAQNLEQRIPLQDDSSKLYVSVYVQSDSQIAPLFEKSPELAKYAKGNHYKVYRSNDPLMQSRFSNVKAPCAYVQKANGEVVFSTCPFRRPDPEPEPEPEPIDPVDTPPDVVPVVDEPIDSDINPWYLLGAAVAGAALGLGSRLSRELRGEN